MKILLATDGSHFSQAAGDVVRRLPWPATRDLTVMRVVDGQTLPVAQQQEAQRLLAPEIERFTARGWTPQTLVRQGHAAHEIVSAAEAMGTNVIAIGSRGLGGIKRFLLGSVSQQVMTYASCSVLIARQVDDDATLGPSDTPLRIMLAYDDSPMAKTAVEMLASLSFDAHTHILVTTVMALMTYYRMDMLQTTSPSWQAEKQAAQDNLEGVAQRLQSISPNVAVQLLESGDASQALLEAAQTFKANLIVVGHRGRSGIERLLLGSVASRMVHHAPCSVWVVRA